MTSAVPRFVPAILALTAACGSATPAPEPVDPDPDAAISVVGSGPVDRAALEALAKSLHDTLIRGDTEAVEGIVATRAELEAALMPETGQAMLIARRADWQSIGEVAQAFRPFGQSLFDGWCARGLRVLEEQDGFVAPTRAVDQMFVVGRVGRSRFGAWIERLVLLPSGWRLLRVSIEPPRENHSSIELWDCDFGEIGLSLTP